MPAEDLVDEVVNLRGAGNNTGGLAARAVTHESVDPNTGAVKTTRGAKVEQDDAPQVGSGRRFKASTEALLAKLEAPPGQEGDPDEDEEATDATGDDSADGDEADADASEGAEDGDADEADEGDADEGDEEGEGEEDEEKPDAKKQDVVADEIKQWQSKAQQYEAANKRLLSELEAAKQTPKSQRSEHEQTLVDAYQSYVDEGSVPALRKFIGAVLGAKPDSKDVDAELSGLYADLTERELNVPLDQSQKAMREAARARLALARDKRERAAESEKKQPSADDDAVVEAQRIEQGAKFIDTQLTVKSQSGTSIADEYPLLMSLAQDFEGMSPAKVLATAIRHEIRVGSLTGAESNEEMIHHVAKQIESYYDGLKAKFAKATPKKTDTTKSGNAAAKPASKEQRQKQGARTINNATASVAPATPPKKKPTTKTDETKPKKFKSDAERREWALRHIPNR